MAQHARADRAAEHHDFMRTPCGLHTCCAGAWAVARAAPCPCGTGGPSDEPPPGLASLRMACHAPTTASDPTLGPGAYCLVPQSRSRSRSQSLSRCVLFARLFENMHSAICDDSSSSPDSRERASREDPAAGRAVQRGSSLPSVRLRKDWGRCRMLNLLCLARNNFDWRPHIRHGKGSFQGNRCARHGDTGIDDKTLKASGL